MIKRLILFFSVLILNSIAEDWPRFMGPNGNDIVEADANFNPDLQKWSKVWEKGLGLGYSAVVVAKDTAFVLSHNKKDKESLYCLNAMTGRLNWVHQYSGPLLNKLHEGGPNASVTVEGDYVYSLGKAGQAFCLNRVDGTIVWEKNLAEIMEIDMPSFGFAGSPVIYNDWVLYTSGRALALHKKTGEKVWISKVESQEEASYHPGHATPVVFNFNGEDYLTFLLGTGLEILKAQDGSRVARHNLKADYNMTATTPIVMDEGKRIFISWNRYSEMLDFSGTDLKSAYKLKNYTHTMQNSVLYKGVIYGTHGKDRGKRTSLMAIDAATGKTLWEQKGFRWAQVTLIGDTLACMDVQGHLTMVKARADKFEELSSRQVLNSISWVKVVYAHSRLYIRGNRGRVISYSIK